MSRAELVSIAVGRCGSCGELWPACACGRPKPPPAPVTDGGDEPATAPPEPPREEGSGRVVEWVSWGNGASRTTYHVRLSTGGVLLCGRTSPRTAPATSFPPLARRCRVCVSKLPELERRWGLS